MSKFYDEDMKLDFSDVLIVPQPSPVASRKDVNMHDCFITIKTPAGNLVNFDGIPVIASNISTIGTIKMANAMYKQGMYCALSKFISNDDLYHWFKDCWPCSHKSLYTLGISKDDYLKFHKLQNDLPTNCKIDKVMIEVANGYMDSFVMFVENFRRDFPEVVIFAGTVCTHDGTLDLINAGADIVRVGIGTGAPCITRIKTGIGYPQLSALLECSTETRHQTKYLNPQYNGKYILSDGGCQNPGDIAKALGAGSNFVMIGSLLAGTDECSHEKNDKGELLYYGMSSDAAQRIHYGEERGYRGSEGRVVYLEPKGPVEPILQDIEAGLRSACSYVGATRLTQLYDKVQFIRVNNQYNRMLEK